MAAGEIKAAHAWPEYFRDPRDVNVPAVGADMSDFTWERPTEQSFQDDLARMLGGSSRLVVPEGAAPPPAPPLVVSDSLEWT